MTSAQRITGHISTIRTGWAGADDRVGESRITMSNGAMVITSVLKRHAAEFLGYRIPGE